MSAAPFVLAQNVREFGSPAAGGGTVRFAGLLLIHAALRRDLLRLPAAIRTLGPRDEVRADAVVRHWQFLADMLLRYHEYQDARLWPLLRRTVPELRLLANWLEADHHGLEQSAAATTACVLETALTRSGAWNAAHVMEGFAIELQGHLRIEETQVLPVMRDAFAEDAEIGTLADLLRWTRAAGPGTADLLAWLLDGVPPSIADDLLHQCDDSAVRQWPHWRDTYARVTAELWDDEPPHLP
ncbi:hemerythrin domain-containing protein [Peterkaempfera bronchialis]|uniref:Hemerythrin domain-containing protein n=1 Tax=Peterkaempfera bronchialis TaxID=2126346 RepID=A0A345STY3_9ACTN|nr:hemerythrin domain-containing protein [Peterkaempfera bronchialis]AXI77188.1 hemerythrin domain-containing protein [Peterkaempfera bronchialis]